ncbi:MAG: hypothetical protein RI901_848, partial [Actinomycetota bacterium]
LSLKATQEDPWQAFARTHTINQVVPGEVTKLVPFGAFIKVFEGIEGLVHISELAERHVEIPEQVVQVGDKLFVKIIDIDLERRRISLSLKQANEGQEVEVEAFDPTQYGMPARYDAEGKFMKVLILKLKNGNQDMKVSAKSGSVNMPKPNLALWLTRSKRQRQKQLMLPLLLPSNRLLIMASGNWGHFFIV